MKEPITLKRSDYYDAIEKLHSSYDDKGSYLDKFTVSFPDGLNTANSYEICRALQDESLETKIRLMKLCVAGKIVNVTCPNGDEESFCLSTSGDSIDGFPLFRNEPLALIAISDSVYGYVLKKYLRLSTPKEAAAQTT